MVLKLGPEQILLRPTFENIAAMESTVGGVAYLGWKYSRGIRLENGKPVVTEQSIRALPPLTECAQIIFYNQAATKPEDPTLKKFSLEEIWDLVLQEGTPVAKQVVQYLAGLTTGDKSEPPKAVSDEEKKS